MNIQADIKQCQQFEYSVGSFFWCHIKGLYTLCDALEEIADTLPNVIDKKLCHKTALLIAPVVEAAHLFEERVLFPVLDDGIKADKALALTVKRLRDEHREDEDFANEIADALISVSKGKPVNSGQLGYMLRGFFEGMRRHIACETEFIFPLIAEEENLMRVNH